VYADLWPAIAPIVHRLGDLPPAGPYP
jgi:hypothetical protein